MSAMKAKSNSAKSAAQLSTESELKKRIAAALRFGKIAGADETEVQIDETIDALSRFANNAIKTSPNMASISRFAP